MEKNIVLGLAQRVPAVSTWPERCVDWMRGRGLLDNKSRNHDDTNKAK